MVEGVKGIEAQLDLHAFDRTERLIEPKIQFVHPTGSNIRPTRRNFAHVGGEVLVDTVLDGVGRRRLVVVSRQVLDAGPGGILRDVCILRWKREKLGGVEPLLQRLFAVGEREVFSTKKEIVS